MIYITCGTCGTSQGYMTAADGVLSLSAAEEKRLVNRGVAKYATRPVIENGADSPVDDGDGGGAGISPSSEDTTLTGLENGGSDIPDGDPSDTVDIVDGHFVKESLLQMKRSELEKLATDCGLDISKCKNKGDLSDLLVAVEIDPPAEDGGDLPPALEAEAPVV